MLITDAQVHMWGPNTAAHPWAANNPLTGREKVDNAEEIERAGFGGAEVISAMDEAGVTRSVVLTPSWYPWNEVALEAAAKYPARLAVMGCFDFVRSRPEDARAWFGQPRMIGMRLNFAQVGFDEYLADGRSNVLLSIAEEMASPVMVSAPGQSTRILEIAKAFPDLRIVLDHFNLNARENQDERFGPALDGLMVFVDVANVAVKMSALPLFVNEPFPYRSLHPHLRRVIDAFGIERCMWGSDFTRLDCSYREAVDSIVEYPESLTPVELQALMDGTVSRWLDWPHSTA